MLKLLVLCAPFELLDDSRSNPGFAPWADYDANTATEVLIEERNTFVEIYLPLGCAAHRYFFRPDGVGWAGISADLATAAKVVNPVIDPGRWDQGHVGEYGCESE